MKQEIKKLKGSTVSTPIGQIILKQYARLNLSQYDQMYFTTNQQLHLCKVYNITTQTSIERYNKQKQIYSSDVYPNLAQCISKSQFKIKKTEYSLLILDKIPKNSSLIEIGNSLSSFQLLQLTKSVLVLLCDLKARNEVYLNLRPENIYLNSEKNFVIINPQFVTEKGKRSSLENLNEFFFGNVEKQFKYCSPEVLDNYTYCPIDTKTDIFSLGTILYEIIFQKYPFQSKFANISIIYEKKQGFFGKLIEKIFKPYKQRAQVEELLLMIEEQLKNNPEQPKKINSSSTNQSKTSSTKNTGSFFDDITSVFNKYTKQSQGAYLNFTQNCNGFPQIKHLNIILNKLYKNPSKVDKLQSIMNKHLKLSQGNSKQYFLLKNLILIMLVLRKNRNYLIGQWNDNINLIKQIVGDKNNFLQLCNILTKKIELQQLLNCVLKGNFLLEDVCQFKILTIDNLKSMMKYMQILLGYSNKLLGLTNDQYLFSYILEVICDQIYDLLSMIIFSIICIRKDNQLGLRKDNLPELLPLQKSLQSSLKKINNLSNKISSHAIYSVQAQYYNYKQQINLTQNPTHTSFQYFINYCNHYKGLSLPQNNHFYSNGNQSSEFKSTELPNKNQIKDKNKNFFIQNGISSEQQNDQLTIQKTVIKQIIQNQKLEINQNSFQQQKQINNNSNKKQNIQNLFGNGLFENRKIKQTPNNQKNVSIIQNKTNNKEKKSQTSKSIGFDDFSNFFGNVQNKKSSIKNQIIQQKNIKKPNNAIDLFNEFTFPLEQTSKSMLKIESFPEDKEKIMKDKKKQILNLLSFNQSPKKNKKQDNPKVKLNQSTLNDDIFSYQWLKKSQKDPVNLIPIINNQTLNQKKQNIIPIFQQPKPSPFFTQIVQSLKLKQLKDLLMVNRDVVIEFTKLIFQKVIGSGSAGQVYLGKYGGNLVAIKKVKIRQNPNALKQFERQLVTYIKIKKNPFLVSLVGLSKCGQDFYLITQFCSGGSLFDLLHKKAGQIFLSWKTKLSLIWQVAKGMKALHDMKPSIIHRDLKSLNVFILQQNNQWIAKVADFGLSRSPQSEMMTMALGTLHWMAPQLLDNKQYSLKVDVYSFAIVMWQICARRTPYYELSNPMAIMKYVTIEKKRPNMSIIDNNCPPKLLELIMCCWDEEPNKRPYFKQIMQILDKINQKFAAEKQI